MERPLSWKLIAVFFSFTPFPETPEFHTTNNQVDYAIEYGEFLYQAGTWSHPRRVVFKIEKPYSQMVHMYTFIVTTIDSAPGRLIFLGTGKTSCKEPICIHSMPEVCGNYDFLSK